MDEAAARIAVRQLVQGCPCAAVVFARPCEMRIVAFSLEARQ
jgi:hypothetical protein